MRLAAAGPMAATWILAHLILRLPRAEYTDSPHNSASSYTEPTHPLKLPVQF